MSNFQREGEGTRRENILFNLQFVKSVDLGAVEMVQWLRHLLLLQKTCVQFLASTWQLTIWIIQFRAFNMFFGPP